MMKTQRYHKFEQEKAKNRCFTASGSLKCCRPHRDIEGCGHISQEKDGRDACGKDGGGEAEVTCTWPVCNTNSALSSHASG